MQGRVLVTGGAGFLGSVIVEELLNKGYEVTVLDSLIYSQDSLLHLCHNRNFTFVHGDVRDLNLMKKLVPKFEYILPLAGVVGAPACDRDPQAAISINYEAIVNLNKIRDHSTQKIIFPTTNSGYGTKTGDVYCTEETPLEPISLYGETKVAAEKALLDSENVITLRLATVFGVSPRMRLDLLVNYFTYEAVKNGYIVIFEKDFKRNYVHIRDVARCFLHCMENFEAMKNNTYNVGLDDANLSKEELALKIKSYIPKLYVHFAEIGSDPDKRNYIVSSAKMNKTGFRCTYSLDDGIVELIKAFSTMSDLKNKNASLKITDVVAHNIVEKK